MARPLSYTQISLYQACPLSYKLQYIDGLRPKDKWYFSFGSTLHLCAEYLFKVKVPPPPSLEALLDFYEAKWLSQGYESAEEEAKYRAYGREILTRFWEIHHPAFRMPLAVEHLFYIDVEGVKLRGYIDRVDKLESGGLSIVDYKSSQNLFTVDDLSQDLQLTLYQLAVQQIWQLPVERLTLYHLRSNTPCSCGPREPAQLEAARRLVLTVAENIARGEFPAVENQYCPCDFPEYCPYYRHQYLAAGPGPVKQGVLPGLVVAEAVEEYVALQSEIKELESRLDELRQVIIDFCQAEGINRVFGEEHAVTYKMTEKTGFDEEAVRALLEPVGLWPQVLGLDPARLRQLLNDEGVAGDIRNRIQALKQVVATFPRLSVRKLTKEE
jgi:putative RecB family exonuclease